MNDNVVIVYNGEQVSVPKEVADFLEQDWKRQQAQDKQDARHLSKSEFETVLSGLECVKRPVEDCLLTDNGGDRSNLWHLQNGSIKPAKVIPPAAFGRRYDFSIRVYEVRSSCAEVCVLHNVVSAQILCCIAQHDLAGFEYIAAIRYLERLIGVLLDDKYSNTALV